MSTTQPIRSITQLQEFKAYYQSVMPHVRNHALLVMGLNTAFRISDILHLTCKDVYDFRTDTWRVHITIREQKTGKKNCIYMNKEILQVLTALAKTTTFRPDAWIFSSKQAPDKPLSRSQAYRIVKKAAVYAGLDSGISCHSLRKTFGYHAWKQGTPPAMLMCIYNHSNYQITKRYLGIDQDDKDAVFARITL